MSSPVPLVTFQNDKFYITKEGERLLKQAPSQPLRVISIVGNAREGKSFLLNHLFELPYTQRFPVGHTVEGCTRGVVASLVPYSGQVYLALDTEGLNDLDQESETFDSRLFCLCTLISHVVLYNTSQRFTEADISSLGFIAEMSKHVKNKSFESPNLIFIIRDFALRLNGSPQEYLENVLAMNPRSESEKNSIRTAIHNFFPRRKRSICTFPQPANPAELERHQSDFQLKRTFTQQLIKLRKVILSNHYYTDRNQFAYPELFFEYLTNIVSALNNDTVRIDQRSILRYIVQQHEKQKEQKILHEFHQQVENQAKQANTYQELCSMLNNIFQSYPKTKTIERNLQGIVTKVKRRERAKFIEQCKHHFDNIRRRLLNEAERCHSYEDFDWLANNLRREHNFFGEIENLVWDESFSDCEQIAYIKVRQNVEREKERLQEKKRQQKLLELEEEARRKEKQQEKALRALQSLKLSLERERRKEAELERRREAELERRREAELERRQEAELERLRVNEQLAYHIHNIRLGHQPRMIIRRFPPNFSFYPGYNPGFGGGFWF